MKKTNIHEVLNMVKEYLDGDMDTISFVLDFPYEVTQRYQKMHREDSEWAEMILYHLVEQGTDLYREVPKDQFRDIIETRFENVVDGVY